MNDLNLSQLWWAYSCDKYASKKAGIEPFLLLIDILVDLQKHLGMMLAIQLQL